MKNIMLIFFCLLASKSALSQANDNFFGEIIKFKSSDGLTITADLYMAHESSAPFIILCHQANYSRGEYREIAPILNEMGFNCMALDQRSGERVNGVENETHKAALDSNLPTGYVNAVQDIEAAYLYVKYHIKPQKTILWGSSYSASIVLYMGRVHYKNITGVMSFSPGEYFKINNKTIGTYAQRITCPVFVTSAKSEYNEWKSIYKNIKAKKEYFLPELQGKHGSKALWANNPSHREYWAAVKKFLEKI